MPFDFNCLVRFRLCRSTADTFVCFSGLQESTGRMPVRSKCMRIDHTRIADAIADDNGADASQDHRDCGDDNTNFICDNHIYVEHSRDIDDAVII